MRILAVTALTACATTTGTTMTDANKHLVRSLYEDYINTGRLEPVAELVAPDYVAPTGEHGPAAFIANIAELRTGFPDIHFTIDQLIAEADRVVVRWTWRATHTGPFRHVAATNKPVLNSGIAIYQIADHKITRNWLETDRLGALQQMGALPAPSR